MLCSGSNARAGIPFFDFSRAATVTRHRMVRSAECDAGGLSGDARLLQLDRALLTMEQWSSAASCVPYLKSPVERSLNAASASGAI